MKSSRTSPSARVESDVASYASALKETRELLAADPTRSIADPTLPFFRLAAHHEMEVEQQRFAQGDRNALLGAIRVCANHDLPLPLWAARAFIAAYDRVLNASEGSWDDVFGRPYPAGTHLSAVRKRRVNRLRVLMLVQDATEHGEPLDDETFSRIGRELGLGKTLVKEYFYGRRIRRK